MIYNVKVIFTLARSKTRILLNFSKFKEPVLCKDLSGTLLLFKGKPNAEEDRLIRRGRRRAFLARSQESLPDIE